MSWTFPEENAMERDEQVRPRRQIRRPPYLDEFHVEYAGQQSRAPSYGGLYEAVRQGECTARTLLNTHPYTSRHQQRYEGSARMTPLPIQSFEGGNKTPAFAEQAKDEMIFTAIKEIRQTKDSCLTEPLKRKRADRKLLHTSKEALRF